MSIENVREHFRRLGIEDRILEFDVSSATVDLAAEAVGVDGARICKTLAFSDGADGCILIQAAGDSKVANGKFKHTFGFKASMLSGDKIEALTGHTIGGVCAFGFENPKVKVYCDESLRRFETVFPACGSSNSAIEFTLDELFRYSRAIGWIDVTKVPEETLQDG